MELTGIHHVTDQTDGRLLDRNGYVFLQAHKKGLISQTDKENREVFAQRMETDYTPNLWPDSIAFYLDGVSTKQNPGTKPTPTKGKHGKENPKALCKGAWPNGAGGKVAKFMVALSYRKGVFDKDMRIWTYFTSFFNPNYHRMFVRSRKGLSRLWLHDGNPSQNSKATHEAMACCQLEL